MLRLLNRPFLVGAAVVVVAGASVAGGLAAANSGSTHGAADHQGASNTDAVFKLRVSSTTPAAGSQLPSDATMTVVFNKPLADDSPQPTLSPAVAGSWVADGPLALEFHSDAGLPPGAQETLDIPGGTHGMVAGDGARMRNSVSVSFSVAPMSVLRTQELLAVLGYLPLTFTAQSSATVPADQTALDEPGTFSWKFSTMPASFTSLWSQGQSNPITAGAIMAFESQMGLATDGIAGPKVWQTLLSATASNQQDSDSNYDWVDVSTTIPESVTVWRNGAPVYTTVANTGIEAARTEVGTWPVYVRYTSTTMKGTNPDGTTYDDPGVPWVSYFHGGDALHGFPRASYGYPQSLGCVEMPIPHAAVVFPFTPLGTLVTVEPTGARANPTTPTTTAPTTSTTTTTTVPTTTTTTG